MELFKKILTISTKKVSFIKEVKKLAQNNWNQLSNQQRKEIAEELTVCKDSEKCIQQLAPVISYSDDGFLLLEYESVNKIFNIMDIFKRFGSFSNLDINCDKADVYHINFSFSKEEKDQLLDYGFMDDKILDENHCLTFLGHRIKPCNLKESAKSQLDETIEGMKNTIDSYFCQRYSLSQPLVTSQRVTFQNFKRSLITLPIRRRFQAEEENTYL